MTKEFIYDDEGRLIRGYIKSDVPLRFGAPSNKDVAGAVEQVKRAEEHRSEMQRRRVAADEHGAFPFGEDIDSDLAIKHTAAAFRRGELPELEPVIQAAADFINDATRDLPPDTFAAVLQAAIARRD